MPIDSARELQVPKEVVKTRRLDGSTPYPLQHLLWRETTVLPFTVCLMGHGVEGVDELRVIILYLFKRSSLFKVMIGEAELNTGVRLN